MKNERYLWLCISLLPLIEDAADRGTISNPALPTSSNNTSVNVNSSSNGNEFSDLMVTNTSTFAGPATFENQVTFNGPIIVNGSTSGITINGPINFNTTGTSPTQIGNCAGGTVNILSDPLTGLIAIGTCNPIVPPAPTGTTITIGDSAGGIVYFPGSVTYATSPAFSGTNIMGTAIINGAGNGTTTIGNCAFGGNVQISAAAPNIINIGNCNETVSLSTGTGSTTIGNAIGTTTIQAGAGTLIITGLTQPSSGTVNSLLIDPATNKIYTSGSSSRRYKRNIKPLDHTISEKIYELEPKSFSYHATPELVEFGLIAEELFDKKIFLNALRFDPEGKVDSIHYHAIFIAMLHEMIRLKKRHDQLEIKCQLLLECIADLANGRGVLQNIANLT